MKGKSDWVELLEGEVDESELGQLDLILRRSGQDRSDFLKLSRLRDLIAATDRQVRSRELINRPTYQAEFTERVMRRIRHQTRPTKVSRKDNLLKIERGSSNS